MFASEPITVVAVCVATMHSPGKSQATTCRNQVVWLLEVESDVKMHLFVNTVTAILLMGDVGFM